MRYRTGSFYRDPGLRREDLSYENAVYDILLHLTDFDFRKSGGEGAEGRYARPILDRWGEVPLVLLPLFQSNSAETTQRANLKSKQALAPFAGTPLPVHEPRHDTMTSREILDTLRSTLSVNCRPQIQGNRIGLEFTHTPPEEPGVYVVYVKSGDLPFYVGEAKNLNQRLKYLFRCHRNDNPHPCHRRHKEVWEEFPECEDFCEKFSARWLTTTGACGRLEIEESLQAHFGTNRKAFYLNFSPVMAEALETASPATDTAPSPVLESAVVSEACDEACGTACPVWLELASNSAYRAERGFLVPTLGQQAEGLRFQFIEDDGAPSVRVWRDSGTLEFTFGEAVCRALCSRFDAGIKEGRRFARGGTGYFNQPKWSHPPLGNINTPYAAAVVRHGRQCCGMPI